MQKTSHKEKIVHTVKSSYKDCDLSLTQAFRVTEHHQVQRSKSKLSSCVNVTLGH